jgi:hypothetical protein
MTADYPVDEVPATPEYVLEVFRDWTAWPVEGEPFPTVHTPLPIWLDILMPCTMSPEQLREGINATWKADITSDEWEQFNSDTATVGDLCRLIAICGRRPVLRPWRSPSGECMPAGAFLTVRSLLAAAGADLCGIMPSAPLAPYHDRLAGMSLTLAQFAPARRPRFVTDYPRWVILSGCLQLVIGMIAFPLGILLFALGLKEAAYAVAMAVLARSIGITILMRLARTDRVEPEQIRTFRDLAYCLAGQEPRRAIQPTP